MRGIWQWYFGKVGAGQYSSQVIWNTLGILHRANLGPSCFLLMLNSLFKCWFYWATLLSVVETTTTHNLSHSILLGLWWLLLCKQCDTSATSEANTITEEEKYNTVNKGNNGHLDIWVMQVAYIVTWKYQSCGPTGCSTKKANLALKLISRARGSVFKKSL